MHPRSQLVFELRVPESVQTELIGGLLEVFPQPNGVFAAARVDPSTRVTGGRCQLFANDPSLWPVATHSHKAPHVP